MYMYIITNSINLCYLSKDVHVHVFPMAHTLTIVDPISPIHVMFLNFKTYETLKHMKNSDVHVNVRIRAETKVALLDYCFITSTSLIPVAVSTWI